MTTGVGVMVQEIFVDGGVVVAAELGVVGGLGGRVLCERLFRGCWCCVQRRGTGRRKWFHIEAESEVVKMDPGSMKRRLGLRARSIPALGLRKV
jgi:hypothetical protein